MPPIIPGMFIIPLMLPRSIIGLSIIIQIIEILRVPEILVEWLRAAIVGLVVSRTINNLIGSIIGGALTSGVDNGAIIGWSI
jgi:hypothetical protein